MAVRRYDTEAMDELVARARAGDVDAAYLADAIDHYRRVYADLLAEREALEERIRSLDLWRIVAPD